MTVDPAELTRISGEVRSGASNYNKYIEEIYSKIKGTLNNCWVGSDYEEFVKNMDSKRPSADSVTKSLKTVAEHLENKANQAKNI